MSKLYELLDRYVDNWAATNPVFATAYGVPGHDHRLNDFSPDGEEAAAEVDRRTVAALKATKAETPRDRIAGEAMLETLELGLEQFDRGEYLRAINILHCPVQWTRQVFDLMPKESEEHWLDVATRLNLVADCLESYRQTLRAGLDQGKVAARRQVVECAQQAKVWSGGADPPPYFDSLVDGYRKSELSSDALLRDLEEGSRAASRAYSEMRDFLLVTYLPGAAEKDAVGLERYQLASRASNGLELDLEDTYRWGWEQLRWVESEMEATAQKILPGQGVEAAKEFLEGDAARAIDGVEEFRQWAQDLLDRTVEELDGVHFDIPEPVKRIEVLIAPPGGALAPHYTGPSEDFSRPGKYWYPTGSKTRFPLWGEPSIAYHEGVPGHHFQIGTSKYLSSELSRPQRLGLTGSSGNLEGWALYAERLMGELGYLDRPEYYLGMLRAQALRSVRVIIDIGMHLELKIPKDQDFHPGETWTPELGLEFALGRSHFPHEMMKSDVDRYLGYPAQAISYKVGERAWLSAREKAQKLGGPAFDLKEWHSKALALGPMGLAQMQRELVDA